MKAAFSGNVREEPEEMQQTPSVKVSVLAGDSQEQQVRATFQGILQGEADGKVLKGEAAPTLRSCSHDSSKIAVRSR